MGLGGSEGLCCHCRVGFVTIQARNEFVCAVMLREWQREREQLRALARGSGERWLQLAKVRTNHFVVILNAGYPYGFLIDWAGVLLPWQAVECVRWADVEAVGAHRLRWAGLEVVEFLRSDECLLDVHVRLLARVKRCGKPWTRTQHWPLPDPKLLRQIGAWRSRP